jgi:hypothetical protein
MESDADIREQIFHNTVRENIVSLSQHFDSVVGFVHLTFYKCFDVLLLYMMVY